MVVAAHPDDDTIGCSAYIARAAATGCAVHVVYVTDGSASHPGSVRFPPARIATLRAAEARASLAILGVHEPPRFLDVADGSLPTMSAHDRGKTTAQIAAILQDTAPEIVLAPWRRDPHPDHVVAWELATSASGLARRALVFGEYEVWLPVRGTAADAPQPGEVRTEIVELSPAEIARKRAAILAHATQTAGLIDDVAGFQIDDALLATWLRPMERLHFAPERSRGRRTGTSE